MKITINQIASIGDIIFIQPIIESLEKNGYTVDLPIRDHLMWLKEYYPNKCLSQLSRSKMDIDSMKESNEYLPLRFANQIIRNLKPDDHSDFENMMLDKYLLAEKHGIKADWKNIRLNFNPKKAQKLFSILEKDIDYVVINNFSQAGNLRLEKPRAVHMREVACYSLIDWYFILSKAKEIHTVSTSICFLLQAMHNSGINIPPTFIYSRPNEDGLRGIKNLYFSYNFSLIDL